MSDDGDQSPPVGFWMGVGALLGMLLGAGLGWLLERPLDQAVGTGACLGVSAGALLSWARGKKL